MLIDVTRLLLRKLKGRLPTGVDRICLAYIRQYGSVARALIHRGRFGGVLKSRTSNELFSFLLEPGNHSLFNAAGILASSLPMPFSKQKSAGKLLFNVGHSGLERSRYARWLVRQKVRPIFMVHDLIPITHPEYCRSGEDERHALRMRNVLKTAKAIITNSQATLDELCRFARMSGWPMPPAIAALPGGGIFPHPPGPRPLDEPYFVMLGTIEPRKNHWLILQIWRQLIERHGMAVPRLVVIGQRGWECENVIDLLERSDTLNGIVFEKSGCSDAEIATYLQYARALLFPSFAEGYGLPVVEALNLSVPVISSNLPVFREFAGNIPEYLDPLDGIGWMTCIEDYSLPESPRRAAQLRCMAQFNPPTWQTHFSAVENLVKDLK